MSLLLSTKLRANLLTYLFTHTDESFYVREIAQILSEDAGNTSRELRNLEAEGIIKHLTKGRVKLYSLDRNYPMYDELKKIVFKTEGVEGSLKKITQKHAGIDTAFIYGSYAKDREKRTSDIDLIIVGKVDRDRFTADIRSIESRLSREINFTCYLPDEFMSEKVKRGSFLEILLKGDIILLKGSINDR